MRRGRPPKNVIDKLDQILSPDNNTADSVSNTAIKQHTYYRYERMPNGTLRLRSIISQDQGQIMTHDIPAVVKGKCDLLMLGDINK